MEKHIGGVNTPQSYLLNIYPQPARDNRATLLGTVERLGNDDRHTFHDIQELLHLLGIDDSEQGEVALCRRFCSHLAITGSRRSGVYCTVPQNHPSDW